MKNLILIYPAYRLIDVSYPYKKQIKAGVFILSYLLVSALFLKQYLVVDLSFCAALVLTPYLIKPDANKTGLLRYGLLSLVFSILTLFTEVQTFYFFAIGFAILFVIESMAGSVGYIPFFLTGLLSSVFRYAEIAVGFPIRLKLSQSTASILQHIGYQVSVNGNVFSLNGREFSVDPACAGLKMMAVSLLIGLFFMAYFERQKGRKFSFLKVLSILAIVLILNVLSNLIRILILSVFSILPGNILHDMVGLTCLILYVIIPSFYFIKLTSKKIIRNPHEKPKRFRLKHIFVNFLLVGVVWITGFSLTKKEPAATSLPVLPLQGYTKEIVKEDIVKLEKTDLLLYIKPLKRFYGAEHNPMICWTGSGYSFTHIQKETVGEKEIFTGILKKRNEVVYAAWWFDSGKFQTTEQSDWRWRALKGENFYLINVNSGNKEKLEEEVKRLLGGR